MTKPPDLAHRLARMGDLDRLLDLTAASIEDGTYFVVESDGHIADYGGWSRRAALSCCRI